MTALLSLPATPAYELVEELREPVPVAGVRRAAPDEMEREELLLRKLGPRGWGRVHQFRNYYQASWGEQGGAVLSPRALEAFFGFLERIGFPEQKARPSVFLTDRGGIELSWEDASGEAVQVEFTRDEAEYYLARTQEEGTMPLSAVDRLSKHLSS